MSIGDLPANTHLLPCLTGPGIKGYRFIVHSTGIASCALPSVGNPLVADKRTKCDPLTVRIDWLELHQDLTDVQIEVELSEDSDCNQALWQCSWRLPSHSVPKKILPSLASQSILPVPPLSQMSFPDDIKHKVCSPVSVAMVLNYYGLDVDPEAFAAQALHTPSGLYGVWPSNMLAASQQGLQTTVRYFKDMEEVAKLLDAGIPVPVSIRFQAGDLPQAPLPESNGHVLVITGISEGMVHVNDPAAATAKEVARHYNLNDFNKAWRRHHCIGYIMHPEQAADV